MVSALVSGSSSPGSSPGWGHCAVFLESHVTLTVPVSTQQIKAGDNPASHPGENNSRSSRKRPHKISSLGGRLRVFRPCLIEILPN